MSEESFKEQSLRYHREPKPGKLEIQPTMPLSTQRDLALAYSPGVAYACEAIVEDPAQVASLTARGNLVGVITNGTAVLGLGAIGPLASKPVMEGKAVLFKKFANIDVFDIEINEPDPDKLVDIVAALEPTFGGINLEDIKAPECFIVEKKLRERMNIPVFHDDQHGTAIVAAAAIYNALRIVDKKIEDVVLTASGAGAASIACINLAVSMGLKRENVYICDSKGVVYEGRTEGMNEYKAAYARKTDKRTLAEALEGADIFMGLSGPGTLNGEMIKKMADKPIILAMANPTPEILPEEARAARPDAIIATGRSDYPNQVNNVLCFPFIFRGALDCGATVINEAMKIACVKAIAELALQESNAEVAKAYSGEQLKFGPEYIIPKPFDPRLIENVPAAIVQAAMDSGVATRPIEDMEAYKKHLSSFVVRSRVFMQPIVEVAKRGQERLVYAEGENDEVLHAVQAVVDEKILRPVLIGRAEVVRQRIEQLGLRIKIGQDIELVEPGSNDQHEEYARHYHSIVGRSGISAELARTVMRNDTTVLAAMMLVRDEADGLICGKVGRFDRHLSNIIKIIGKRSRDAHISSLSTVLLPDGPIFLADCYIRIDPSVEEIVETTKMAVARVRRFGIIPKVALLSHSNFGTSNAPSARKMRDAAELLREIMPDVSLDGEMHTTAAFNEDYRKAIYADNRLSGNANLLIFPNMDAAHIGLGLLRSKMKGLLVGPFISGLAKPAHVLVNSVTPRGIYNMSALASADIVLYKESRAQFS